MYRKDTIGTAGQVYGRDNQLHFEIVCDDANLQRLIGRQTGDLNTGGRAQGCGVRGTVFPPADRHARTPRSRSTTIRKPTIARREPRPTSRPYRWRRPIRQETLIVGLRYAAGDGAANQRGHAYLTTYQEDGTPLGAHKEPDAEYNLYDRATADQQILSSKRATRAERGLRTPALRPDH